MNMAAVALVLAAAATPLSAQAAPRIAMTLSGTDLADLVAVRERVRVDWFSGDTASLRTVLGLELVAIAAGVPHWHFLEQSLAASSDFRPMEGSSCRSPSLRLSLTAAAKRSSWSHTMP